MYLGLWLLSARHVSTLLHPHCTPGPSPYVYKRKVQGSRTRRWPRGRTGRRARLSLSPSRTLVTHYCKRIRPGRRTTRRLRFPLTVSPPFVFRLAPTHPGWDTQRQFTRRSRDPPGSKRRHLSPPIGKGDLISRRREITKPQGRKDGMPKLSYKDAHTQ
jgi:hypothetical protein